MTTKEQEIATLMNECNNRLQYLLRVKNYYVRYIRRKMMSLSIDPYELRIIILI